MVSCTQVKALIRAAEEQVGLHPWRRTDLQSQRLENQVKDRKERDDRYKESLQALEKARAKMPEPRQQIQDCQTQLETAEQEYQEQGRKERPFSKPGKLRSQFEVLQRGKARLEKKIPKLEEQLTFRRKHLMASLETERELGQRLEQYDQENVANAFPIQVVFRIDAGFGTPENVAWLIEMGHDVYSRPYGGWFKPRLKRMAEGLTWSRVGNNAEMIVWKGMKPEDFPYPLNVSLERFHTGPTLRYSAMLHFGSAPVTSDPAGWLTFYNARQTVEAGIKEGKGTFAMHYLKVRSKPALYFQEQFARLAANFVH